MHFHPKRVAVHVAVIQIIKALQSCDCGAFVLEVAMRQINEWWDGVRLSVKKDTPTQVACVLVVVVVCGVVGGLVWAIRAI